MNTDQLKNITLRTGSELIADERRRQIEMEGYSQAHDDAHKGGELAKAAAAYAMPTGRGMSYTAEPPELWPWEESAWKPSEKDSVPSRIRELAKAGALIAAEIDRLKRLQS